MVGSLSCVGAFPHVSGHLTIVLAGSRLRDLAFSAKSLRTSIHLWFVCRTATANAGIQVRGFAMLDLQRPFSRRNDTFSGVIFEDAILKFAISESGLLD